MTIITELNNELKLALRRKDEKTKSFIRCVKSKIEEHLVNNRLDRDKIPNDELVINVIAAYKKSLERAVAMLEKGGGGSSSLAIGYKEEAEFCGKYLPDVLEDADLVNIVEQTIKELEISDVKFAGRVVGHIMKNHKDRGFNGSLIKNLVVNKLQE
jgi:uncharacterized protein YqeY